jgi:hypothetical protein
MYLGAVTNRDIATLSRAVKIVKENVVSDLKIRNEIKNWEEFIKLSIEARLPF